MKLFKILLISSLISIFSCSDALVEGQSLTDNQSGCTDVAAIDFLRGACNETLAWSSEVEMTVTGNTRSIISNGIPGHRVGLFGDGSGSLNPNSISEQNARYEISANPQIAEQVTQLFDRGTGPQYSFGVTLGGVEVDPEAAEPWPHARPINFNNVNWTWNLDAMSINLGLDCNNAHVQPTGKYHYHGAPTLFLQTLSATSEQMTLVGYAADGFPIYYKYGYSESNANTSAITTLQSSYRLKSGERPGDGSDAPCGAYSGIYTADYEYIDGLGDLDECNGRVGVTPQHPQGTYYYVITDSYPYIGRCLVGSPSPDFKIR